MTGRTVVIRDRSEVARALRRGVATLAVVAALTWLLPDSEARDRSAPSWLWWVLLLALVVGLTWRGVVRAGVLHLAEDGVRCHGRSYSWSEVASVRRGAGTVEVVLAPGAALLPDSRGHIDDPDDPQSGQRVSVQVPSGRESDLESVLRAAAAHGVRVDS